MVINPRNFGASPELADNTNALQASLDAVSADDIWVLDPGVWRFDGRTGLQLPQGLIAIGAGGSLSILKATPDDPLSEPGQVRALVHKAGRVEMVGIGLVGPDTPRHDGFDARSTGNENRGQHSSTGLFSDGQGKIVLTACTITQFRLPIYVNNKYENEVCPTSIIGCSITGWEVGILFRPYGGILDIRGSRIRVDESTHTGEQPGHALYIARRCSYIVEGGELTGGDARPDGTNGFPEFVSGWAAQHYASGDKGKGTGTYRGVLFTGNRGVLASSTGATVLESCTIKTTEIGIRAGLDTLITETLFDIPSGRWVASSLTGYHLTIKGCTCLYSGTKNQRQIHLDEKGKGGIVNVYDSNLLGDHNGGQGGAIYVGHNDAKVEVISGVVRGGWYSVNVKKGRCIIHQRVVLVGSATAPGGVLENYT